MNKNPRIALTVIAFLIVGLLIGNGFISYSNKKAAFEKLNADVALYAKTTPFRLLKGVVTIPGGSVVVGLQNGKNEYTTSTPPAKGTISVAGNFLKTEFIPGVFGKIQPRLDALVPMTVTGDAQGGSTYVVLFWDRGDAIIEESYVRLGGLDVVIQKIDALSPDTNTNQEYQVAITYKLEGISQKTGNYVSIPKEAIVPVIDGHFDPKGTVSK